MHIGEEATKKYLFNSQLSFSAGLPHLTGSKVSFCHLDRTTTIPGQRALKQLWYCSFDFKLRCVFYSCGIVPMMFRSSLDADTLNLNVHPSSISMLAPSDHVPSLPASPLSPHPPSLAGFPMHAKSTVNVGSGDPPRWSSKVNMAPAVH